MYLRCVAYAAQANWKVWLLLAEFWYNTSFHSSLRCSPFKAFYGYDPSIVVAPDRVEKTVADILAEREARTALVKEYLVAAQNRRKIHAHRQRIDREFQVRETRTAKTIVICSSFSGELSIHVPSWHLSFWVNLIHAITNFTVWKYTIELSLIR